MHMVCLFPGFRFAKTKDQQPESNGKSANTGSSEGQRTEEKVFESGQEIPLSE